MQWSGLSNLEELSMKCLDEGSRGLISEAVACYNAGSYRASIVISWISVVYDIIQKIRELEIMGDKAAQKHFQEIGTFLGKSDEQIKKAQDFEGRILDIAYDMEMINRFEYEALHRIKDDRNKCAHPALISLDNLFQPSAELARMHIRSVIECVLQNPPLQGKAAIDKFEKRISSDVFPDDDASIEACLIALGIKALRSNAIRNLTVVMLKSILLSEYPPEIRRKYIKALGVTMRVIKDEVRKTIENEFPRQAKSVEENNYIWLIRLMNYFPSLWDIACREGIGDLLTSFTKKCDVKIIPAIIIHSVKIDTLHYEALRRIKQVSDFSLSEVLRHNYHEEDVFLESIRRLSIVDTFSKAVELFDTLYSKMRENLSEEQIKRILEAVVKNSQLYRANGILYLLEKMLREPKEMDSALKMMWIEVGEKLEDANERYSLSSLKTKISEL